MKVIKQNYKLIENLLLEKGTIYIECPLCNISFKKIRAKILKAIKNNKQIFCSKKCSQWKQKIYNCLLCNKQISRTPSQIKGNIFCNHSCAAQFNGNKFPKRIKQIYYCQTCKIKEVKYRNKYCSNECNPKYINYNELTLTELKMKLPSLIRYHSKIREHSRYTYFNSTSNRVCEKCKYDKHIEVSHIKPVSTFPKTSKIHEVNHISNLIGLCPNCHWESDNMVV